MSLKKISKYLFHPTTIKIVGLICIVGFFFIFPVFAMGLETTNTSLKSIQEGMKNFISICSRGWVILAILAGKLMTNDFVYGAFLHMDIYLWKIWNIMKNFANFALVALVLGSIIKNLVGKEALDVKKIITNTLLAGILIQASWFVMGALIDLSTVATASISSFPIAFLSNDQNLKDEINTSIQNFKSKRIAYNLNAEKDRITTIPEPEYIQSETTENLRKNILPSYTSVSGPFIYLGMGVFHFQNYLGTEITTDGATLTLGFALRAFWLLLFTVGLLLLVIANIMRIGLLWIFIIGSPFLILMQVFKPKTGNGSGILKIFTISNLIAIIFKPVIFVIGMSLMLIVIVSMQKSMLSSGAGRENNLNGVSLSKTSDTISTLSVDGVSSVSIDQKDLLGPNVIETSTNFFSQTLILLLAIFLMRRFVKLSLTIGGGPIEELMKKYTGRAEDLAKSAPILPFKGGASLGAIQGFTQKNRDKLMEGVGINMSGKFGERDGNGNFITHEEAFDTFMSQKAGGQATWTNADYKGLDTLANSPDTNKYTTFFDASKKLAQGKQGGLSVSTNTAWMKSVKTLLSNESKVHQINGLLKTLSRAQFSVRTTESEEEYFKKDSNSKALYDAMGGSAATQNSPEPQNYDDLKNIVFYRDKE